MTTFTLHLLIVACVSIGWLGVVGIYRLVEHRVLTPPDVSFIQSDIWSAEGFKTGGFIGYEFWNGFKTEIEGLNLRTDATRSGNLLSTGDLSSYGVMLNGIYEFKDGSWHLTPYVGGGFGMVDVSEWLLGNSAYDRVTAYQLRGGVTLGLTQKLLGSLEYRWTNGSKPYLSLAGIPAKLEVNRRGFVVGVNYHF